MKAGAIAALLAVSACGPGARSQAGWQIPFYGSDAAPVAHDSIIYAGDARGELMAVDRASGRVLWRHTTGAVINAAPLVTTALVVLASEDRTVTALDPRTGAVRWTVTLSQPSRGAAAAGDLLFIAAGTELVALDSSGRRVWSRALGTLMPDAGRRAPSIPLVMGDVVYVAAQTARNVTTLFAVDRASGTPSWTADVATSGVPQPLVVSGVVVMPGTYPEALYGFHATTGRPRWTYAARCGTANIGEPVMAGRAILFATDCAIHSVDPQTGAAVWTTPGEWQRRIVARNRVVVGLTLPDVRLRALDATSGDSLWSMPASDESRLLAATDSVVHVAAGSDLIGFDLRSGRALYRLDGGAEVSSGPLALGDMICFASGVAYTSLTTGFEPRQGRLRCAMPGR